VAIEQLTLTFSRLGTGGCQLTGAILLRNSPIKALMSLRLDAAHYMMILGGVRKTQLLLARSYCL